MADLTESAKSLRNNLLAPLGKPLGQAGGEPVQLLKALPPASGTGTGPIVFNDRNPEIDDHARLMNALAALLVNLPEGQIPTTYAALHQAIAQVTASIEARVASSLDEILHDPEFQTLEANWVTLNELAGSVTHDDVIIDFMDLHKDELRDDLQDNAADIFGGALFHKVYVEEYDRYGGRPFATMIGLYEFDSDDSDVEWLDNMSQICAAAHCPFIASANSRFFRQDTMQDVAVITDLDAVVNHPKHAKWNALRDKDFAAYIGLTLPRYLVRAPWDGAGPDASDRDKRFNHIGYTETVHPGEPGSANNFLWGNAAILFAKNIVRSYEQSGWAQYIRGPRGGGIVEGMTVYTFKRPTGQEELQPPVEVAIPDYREYQFARSGLIPLVQRKSEASATFFSAQSIKKPKDFIEDINTKNAYLVTNLAYTFSVTIIAHYVKVMMREYIGSSADDTYIQNMLSNWLGRYVTTVTNPDDLTLLYYPFKATSVKVTPKPGPFGWYNAVISVLPHSQFEGMDVELRLEASLGGKAA